MLLELHVQNFALIDQVDLEFGERLNLLTGETGAGKSILIDALGLALGDRSLGGDIVRTGAKSATVEAVFSLDNLPEALQKKITDADLSAGDDDANLLIVSREITATGKNQCRINGRLVPVSLLREICRPMIDIHGQHEHQAILAAATHIDLLDNWLGDEAELLREKTARQYAKLSSLQKELDDLRNASRERARNQSLLQYQVDEIEAASLAPGEEEALTVEKNRLAGAEKLAQWCGDAESALSGPVIDGLNKALAAVQKAAGVDAELDRVVESLATALDTTVDSQRELRRRRENVEYNPERLEEIEERIHQIRGLKRKYGETIEEIIAYCNQSRESLKSLENQEEREQQLKNEIDAANDALVKTARHLTKTRTAGGKRFAGGIIAELQGLGMTATRFEVDIAPESLSAKGADRIEFLLSPNPGEPLRPLVKIASGGEASRIMLAIKSVLAKTALTPTMIFDEIDTGVGGRTATAVAAKLEELGNSTQLICITHLPQIASRKASAHFFIEKQAEKNRTIVSVRKLSSEQRVAEITRMLGGDASDTTAAQHARQLLGESQV